MGQIVDASEVWLRAGLSASITEEERAIVQQALVDAEGAVKRFLRYDPVRRSRTEFYPRVDQSYAGAAYIWDVSAQQAYIRQLAEETTSELRVQHVPVRSSPAIDLRIDYGARAGTVAGSFAAATLQTEGTDYWPNYTLVDSDGNSVCLDGIIRTIGLWPTVAGAVRIVYTAGYSENELHGVDNVIDASPIRTAVINEAVRRTEKAFVRRKSTALGWVAGIKTSESLGDYSYSVDAGLATKLYGDEKELMDESKKMLATFQNMALDI